MKKVLSKSARETMSIAKKWAKDIKPGSIIALKGNLGAGKTTFIRGLAAGLGLKNLDEVKSPTFVVMHIYHGKTPIYHFDLYRLDDEKDFETIGLEEFLGEPSGVTCVEWAEKAKSIMPKVTHWVSLTHRGAQNRMIEIQPAKL